MSKFSNASLSCFARSSVFPGSNDTSRDWTLCGLSFFGLHLLAAKAGGRFSSVVCNSTVVVTCFSFSDDLDYIFKIDLNLYFQ